MSYSLDISLDSFSFLCYFMGIMGKKEGMIKIRCQDCGKFLSAEQRLSTLREPDMFYCHSCMPKNWKKKKLLWDIMKVFNR